MVPLMWFAVLAAVSSRGAFAHQQLVLYGPRDWEKVQSLEYKIDREVRTDQDSNSEGWVRTSPTAAHSFAFHLPVQRDDRVSLRLTMSDGLVTEDMHVVGDVRSPGTSGMSRRWEVGPVPLFSQLENVRHADVWKAFVSKLQEVPEEELVERMGRAFEEADKEHQGWHVVVLVDNAPAGSVELTYATPGGGVRRTTKQIASEGGLFTVWSIENAAGQFNVSFGQKGEVAMQVENLMFHGGSLVLPGGREAHVYILPFESHQLMDEAWREIQSHQDAEPGDHLNLATAFKYWDDAAGAWRAPALEELAARTAASGVAAAAVGEASATASMESSRTHDLPLRLMAGLAGVCVVLLAVAYFSCAAPGASDVDSATQSSEEPEAPCVHGESWPQESVRELVPPEKVA